MLFPRTTSCMEEVLCKNLLWVFCISHEFLGYATFLVLFQASMLSFATNRFFFLLNGFKMCTNQMPKIPFPFNQLVEHKWKEWWMEHFVSQRLLDCECTGNTRRFSEQITNVFWVTVRVFNE